MRHILIAEDDEAIRRYLTILLERHGYKVTAFCDGKSALDFIKANVEPGTEKRPFDLLITDVQMPILTGFELIDILHDEDLNVPTMAITASAERELVIDALRKGCYEFVDKPIVEKHLLEGLERALKKVEIEDTKSKKIARISDTQRIMEEKSLGKYKLNNIIGEGACGTVYLAEHSETNEKYAVKILRLCNADPKANDSSIKRFIHESNAISQLKHPNIVNFYEFGYIDNNPVIGAPYIVMEYFPGRSLRDYITNRVQTSLDDKINIITQIGHALASVHEKNILHRDIKPDNILINDKLKVKITDFGVCHLPTSDLTMTAELIGSPAYMAPEYLRYGQTGKFMDIYALGIVTYELMVGKKPFDADSISELIKKVFYEKPVAPDKLLAAFPQRLQDILAKMIRKNPARRYQDASELLLDLKCFKECSGFSSCIEKTKRFFNYKFDWK